MSGTLILTPVRRINVAMLQYYIPGVLFFWQYMVQECCTINDNILIVCSVVLYWLRCTPCSVAIAVTTVAVIYVPTYLVYIVTSVRFPLGG